MLVKEKREISDKSKTQWKLLFAYFLWFHVGKVALTFYIFCLTILICKSFLGTATIQKETNTNSNITAIIQKKTNSHGGPSSFCHLSEPGHLSLATHLCFLQSSFKAEFPITFMLPLASQAHHNLHCSLLILYGLLVCVALSSVSFLSSYVKTLLRIRVHMLVSWTRELVTYSFQLLSEYHFLSFPSFKYL